MFLPNLDFLVLLPPKLLFADPLCGCTGGDFKDFMDCLEEAFVPFSDFVRLTLLEEPASDHVKDVKTELGFM